ncbi:heptaprenyl diphosphate synthase subunit II [Limnochorda pilosa]|uniref:Heptaprenyl diphosphate synthase subunit II n=1 Tax=Limnochorda pilosa TaxID=1555112 RepID=A0A0K2SPR1_LIMPI|nr:heptaprenyl diphosphate synthase subunit II [Limnochorda pilosa]
MVYEPMEKAEARLLAAFDDAPPEARAIALHLVQGGGKRVRPLLVLLSARLFGEDLEPAIPVAAASEMIHMATLVHDDVIDEADTRRGRPTAGRLWGNVNAVLSGDALLARALVMLTRESRPEIVQIMSEMVYRMCEGEIIQNARAADPEQEERDYFDRIERKTALFFAACCQAGALAGGASPDQAKRLWHFGRSVGMAFQVIDDLLDVVADGETIGKPAGRDLAEGVITLPILYLLKHPHHRRAVRPLLDGGIPGTGEIQTILRLVRENGATEYTYQTALRFAGEAKDWLDELPATPLRQVLASVADFSVERRV